MVDTAKVYIKAGGGGDGIIHFRREKFIPKGGPDGGDGGRGGSIFIEVDKDLATLDLFAYKQKFLAEDGEKGKQKKQSGKAGGDLVIKVPRGTVIKLKYSDKDQTHDLSEMGTKLMIAKGGRGGRGNWHFKSSTNTTPREAELGEAGEELWLEMELKLLAEVGIVGFPNVGKSTLLSVLSNARPKIADYEFTTLEPNLGVLTWDGRSLVMADIPGLIEGASLGRGLGDKFLRHTERTKILVHVMAGENEGELWKKYQVIRKELAAYGGELEEKKEIAVLNKTDLLNDEIVKKVVSYFAKKKIKLIPISCGNRQGINDLIKRIFLDLS